MEIVIINLASNLAKNHSSKILHHELTFLAVP
jgi:hypothetical protein